MTIFTVWNERGGEEGGGVSTSLSIEETESTVSGEKLPKGVAYA
jgi:hypothetical protein